MSRWSVSPVYSIQQPHVAENKPGVGIGIHRVGRVGEVNVMETHAVAGVSVLQLRAQHHSTHTCSSDLETEQFKHNTLICDDCQDDRSCGEWLYYL